MYLHAHIHTHAPTYTHRPILHRVSDGSWEDLSDATVGWCSFYIEQKRFLLTTEIDRWPTRHSRLLLALRKRELHQINTWDVQTQWRTLLDKKRIIAQLIHTSLQLQIVYSIDLQHVMVRGSTWRITSLKGIEGKNQKSFELYILCGQDNKPLR